MHVHSSCNRYTRNLLMVMVMVLASDLYDNFFSSFFAVFFCFSLQIIFI